MSRSSNYAISFIIPVYNGEGTILRCLSSIFSKEWGDFLFEVIVIDDCSTDNTERILDEQSKIYKNLTVIHQPINNKPGTARNRGLEIAQGEYVMCVDSDDTVENGIITALGYAIKSSVDILFCRIQEQSEFDGTFSVKEYRLPEHISYSGQSFCEQFYTQVIAGALSHFLFKRTFIENTKYKFAEGVVFEDLDWTEIHLYKALRIEFDSSLIYSYYATPSSILHSNNISQDADKLLFCYRRLFFAESIKDNAPRFSERIFSTKGWITQIFSFRHMTRHSNSSIKALYDKVGTDALSFFSRYSFSGFPRICINHPLLAKLLLRIGIPLCVVLRSIKNRGTSFSSQKSLYAREG